MEDFKIVSVGIYNPKNSVFKSNRNDKATCEIIKCSSSENCSLLKKGQCTMSDSLGWVRCPYSRITKEEGFTPKAIKFHSWINERVEKYSGIPRLKSHSKVIAEVGNYIFLPYNHMDMCDNVPFIKTGMALSKGQPFILKNEFTVDVINTLLSFNPKALFGGIIESYQKEVVPRFIEHLRDYYPDLFRETLLVNSRLKDYVKADYIGRKAVLQTLNANVGSYQDIHGKSWLWDGEWLTCKESVSIFGLSNKNSETKVKPEGKVEVKITDNNQVNSESIILD